jgi:hypothetical protein
MQLHPYKGMGKKSLFCKIINFHADFKKIGKEKISLPKIP